jgi:hypothetical protein
MKRCDSGWSSVQTKTLQRDFISGWATNRVICKWIFWNTVKGPKYPSKYGGYFCPAIGNTGVISGLLLTDCVLLVISRLRLLVDVLCLFPYVQVPRSMENHFVRTSTCRKNGIKGCFMQICAVLRPFLKKCVKRLLASSCLSVQPSLRPHGTTRLPPEGFLLNFVFECFW